MQAGGLEAFNSSTGPLLFLVLPGEVRELTYTEDILIAACNHETIISDNLPVKISAYWGKNPPTITKINGSTEIIMPFKTHCRPRVSDFQCPTHKSYWVPQEV